MWVFDHPMAKPLPHLATQLEASPTALEAYAHLLPLQYEYPVDIRLCGWMMIHAPVEAGREYVAECVNRCTSDEEIVAVGHGFLLCFAAYYECLLLSATELIFVASQGQTQQTHIHRQHRRHDHHWTCSWPTKPLYLKKRPETTGRLKYRYACLQLGYESRSEIPLQALIQDDYCCVLSGEIDTASVLADPDLEKTVNDNPGKVLGATQCAHILPQCLNQGFDDPAMVSAYDIRLLESTNAP